ncbi:AbiH family protein, partial [Acinetobacter variabilis]|uniref:AbiH family protein n=2 Tax=Acinetobacter TaxID=469 RepID=UPI003D76935F
MNILIVGNGFDLSHYLPTKYDHFMDVMSAIETSKSNSMNFDELFSKFRENWFIAKTKEYYLIENIFLKKDQLTTIQKMLKENSWYQYFKSHVQEIKTWIDFEQKIEYVLIVAARCIADIENIYNSEELYKYFDDDNDIKIRTKDKN